MRVGTLCSQASPAARLSARRWVWTAALVLVVAFAWLGTRPLWDPDEGRYTNVALNMLERHDWVIPVRNDDTAHWTKPPLTYWALAGSFALLGPNPWAARLPNALAFLACCGAVALIAKRLGLRRPSRAVAAYASMLMPALAVQLVTTDFLLSAFEAWTMVAFVSWVDAPSRAARRWAAFGGAVLALGFMTKGPPALLVIPVMLGSLWWCGGDRAGSRPVWRHALLAGLVFAALALPWFVWVVAHQPGLLEHLLGAEVRDRLLSDRHARHAQWYGWLWIYLPTLLIGSLPWTGAWLHALRRAWREARRGEARNAYAARLTLLWIGLPLLIFCLARSRLPLYLLPLFVPVALMVAWYWQITDTRGPALRAVLASVLLVLMLRILSPWIPSERDASAWSEVIRSRVGEAPSEVVFIEDKPRFGLHLYLGSQVERIGAEGRGRARFDPDFDETLDEELDEVEPGRVFVTPEERWTAVAADFRTRGREIEVLGEPYRGRVIFLSSRRSQAEAPLTGDPSAGTRFP